jgi:hypothetical protein
MPYARLTGAPLGIATLLAIVVHIVMLLSIRFDISPTNPPTSKQTIDISLIVPASPLKPEQADSLTPTNQQASNNKVQNRQASKQQAKPKPTKKQSHKCRILVTAKKSATVTELPGTCDVQYINLLAHIFRKGGEWGG